MTPYYIDDISGITLYHGDCREILPTFPDKSFDLVLTDPPYGVNKAMWDDVFPAGDVWEKIADATRDGGSVVVYPGEANAPEKIALLARYFNYQWLFVWYKPNAMQFGKTGYSVQSIAWWFSVGPVTARPKMRDVIVCPIIPSENDFSHPSPKPIGSIAPIISGLSDVGYSILDPFCGSGTTLVAAKQLGRKAVGIEIEEKYCEIAVKRLAQMELFV